MNVVVVSDLHLGAATAQPADEAAFVSFLAWLVERSGDAVAPLRLVVLGDLLDLLHASAAGGGVVAALGRVASRHRAALAALGAAADAGVAIDVVPGNHDSELLEPDVQGCLRRLIAAAAHVKPERLESRLRFQPWFVLMPGLLYAEHGSQYHPLNAIADPLRPYGRWSGRLPLGAVLDLYLSGTEGVARAAAGVRLLPAALRSLARRDRPGAASALSLAARARETGLDVDTLAALRGLAQDSAAALLRSAAARDGAGLVEVKQQHASRAVQKLLAGVGKAVPVFVFGHTHRAAHAVLDAGELPLHWLNSGAWAGGAYGFVEVSGRPGGVSAGLRRWDPAARTASGTRLPSAARQERPPADRARGVGTGSAVPVARP